MRIWNLSVASLDVDLQPFSVEQRGFKEISESKKGIDSKEQGGNVTKTTEPKGGLKLRDKEQCIYA